MKITSWILLTGMGALLATFLAAQEPTAPVRVIIRDGKLTATEPVIPVDPLLRIRIGTAGNMHFGLAVEGKNICCSPNGSIWTQARIDGQEVHLGQPPGKWHGQQQLPPGPFGKVRHGLQSIWTFKDVHITQVLEVVPSKPSGKPIAGQKRRLDTCRVVYVVENKGTQPHTLELRVGIDILIVNNDGALFASPTTMPGKILNGVTLQEKTLPEFIQVLQKPDLQDPGFVACMTFKQGPKLEGPNRVVLTSLGGVGGGWNIPAMPAGGDSACILYWPAAEIKPGSQRQLSWAYGGGIASALENEGKVSLALGGSFAIGKLFTVAAYVDDPLPGQTLTLELPEGLQRLEGASRQPVPPPASTGTSLVMWKGRVLQTGNYDLKVHSSTGTIQSKNILIMRDGDKAP